MALLNSIVAELGSHAPTGVDPICHKARVVSWLLSLHFYLYTLQFDICFYLTIALVLI